MNKYEITNNTTWCNIKKRDVNDNDIYDVMCTYTSTLYDTKIVYQLQSGTFKCVCMNGISFETDLFDVAMRWLNSRYDDIYSFIINDIITV